MVTSLIKHERIETTVAKAKELRHVADKVVGHAKKGDIHNRQLAARIVREKPALTKLFEILGPRYADRDGGYTRVLKLAKPRKGDNAPMAIIEVSIKGKKYISLESFLIFMHICWLLPRTFFQYVDRPGEVRAARPPARRKARNLAEVLEDVGIVPIDFPVVKENK